MTIRSSLFARTLSLRFRITLLVILAIVVILGTATLVIDYRVDNEVAQRADANLLERAQALADIFNTQNKASSSRFPSYRIPTFLADSGTVLFHIDCHDQHVVSSDDAASLAWPALSQGQSVAFADIVQPHDMDLRAITLRFSPESHFTRGLAPDGSVKLASTADAASGCLLGLAVDRSEVLDFQESMDRIELGCVVLGFLAVAILAPLLVMRGLRPLSGLAKAMERIGPETPSVRLADMRITELSPLTARFNEVLSRMEEGLLRERQFASGVAHELRTPLAELRTAIEVELRYPSGRDTHAILTDLGEVGTKMERIVTALLMLTRIEAGIEKLSVQQVDVSALTQALIERHGDRVRQHALTLRTDIASAIVWNADPTLLDVVLGNLLSNALTYASTGSTVVVQCSLLGWSVMNAAPDLSAEDVLRMKQRFWRKGKDAGVHTGLGLVLAASAAHAQSLRLTLSLNEGHLLASVTP
ncbi:histidine kinase dimerization/phospho-acceptor domain-containing protein [Dyella sp. 2HG41-7]|uniref:sensor histidine kinase n=1 Tax=Dyella sp. 2HG41-7 TaxID=2883239 RepID=UPI001F1BBBA6|nr:histidine kinase dimerization/phospho-acceptor domain-containing protein [Dyella sp. 2HG41-7]